MSRLREKLKQPFNKYSKEKEDLLDSGWSQLEEHKALIRRWPLQKKRLHHYILTPLKKWTADLKRLSTLPNLKRYHKEKKKLL